MNPAQLALYAITDCDHLTGQALIEKTEALIKGGVTAVQFRDKKRNRFQVLDDCRALCDLCHRHRVLFIVNDHVELAREVGADGVHIGQDDGSCRLARMKLGPDKIIGVSAHNVDEAQRAIADGADYLGSGAVFTSASKNAALLSHDELRAICSVATVPVVAIGGINQENAVKLSGTGISGLAVISALYRSDNAITSAQTLLAISREVSGITAPAAVTGLILNTDGTLADTLSLWDQLPIDYLESQNRQAGPDLAAIIQDKTMPEAAAYIKHNYSVNDGVVDILSDWDYDLEKGYRRAKKQPGCDALLAELSRRDLPFAIATDAPKDLCKVLMESTGIQGASGIASGVDDRQSKTDAAFYRRAAEHLEADPTGIWVVEDSLAGVHSALRAGYHAAAIRNQRHSDAEWQTLTQAAEVSFQNLSDMVNWLRATS